LGGGKGGGLPAELARLQTLLTNALTTTQALWPALQIAWQWVHQAADILENHGHLDGDGVSHQLQALLNTMQDHQDQVAALGNVVERFSKVTANYAPGLFYTYDVADVPRTNNDLEQCFGSIRWHERRTTGHKQAVPGLVVRGPVRVLAAAATHYQCFCVQALQLRDPQAWYDLRDHLAYREENRRMQFRFRKDPSAFLATLEDMLIKPSLPP
jgi:hypothetical protein